jgi:hypothetical protein
MLEFDLNKVNDFYINDYVAAFCEKNKSIIGIVAKKINNDYDDLYLSSFTEVVASKLKDACYSFVNNGYDPKHIEKYLIGSVHKITKEIKSEDKKNLYICPCCRFFSEISILDNSGKKLSCFNCLNKLNNSTSEWETKLYSSFENYSRKGYSCPECKNFIPETNKDLITCPYPRCFFVGEKCNVKQMKHPKIKGNDEVSFDDSKKFFNSNESSYMNNDLIKDNFNHFLNILNDIIDTQAALVHYKCNESSVVIKSCVYDAYKSMIKKYPNEMVNYLVFLNRGMNLQNKIFQEFISIFEKKIPYTYNKGLKKITVDDICDKNLHIFDGVSEFNHIVDQNNEIYNMTTELYVGGRKGSYCRNFYIGKVLDVLDIDKNISIMKSVEDYNFFSIKMKSDIEPGTKVAVKHLRVPPHYQMGALVHINRIRRAIVDKVYIAVNGKKRETRKSENEEVEAKS